MSQKLPRHETDSARRRTMEFQQHWRRFYAQGERKKARRKADQNSYCRQRERRIDDFAVSGLGSTSAIHGSEVQDG